MYDKNKKYHPFAYSYEITQEKVFIPTRQYNIVFQSS